MKQKISEEDKREIIEHVEEIKTLVQQSHDREVKTEEKLHNTIREFVITDENLLQAIRRANILVLHGGNTVCFQFKDADKKTVVFPGNVPVNNVNKNIYTALKQLHKEYLEEVSVTA